MAHRRNVRPRKLSGSPQVAGFALVVLFAILLLTPASMGTSEGELTFAQTPHLTGTLQTNGTGELQLFPGPELSLTARAQHITVEEYVAVTHDLFGGEVGGDAERDDHTFTGALKLTDTGDDFRGLLLSAEHATLQSHPQNVTRLPLLAYHDPGLLLDEVGTEPQHRPGDGRVWTYQADGARFPLPTAHATSQGSPSLYLWDATFEVGEPGAKTTFTGGNKTTQVAPGYERIEHTYHLIRFENADVEIHASPGTHTAWFFEPTLTLSGTVASNKTYGTLDHDGKIHHLDNVPLTASGRLVINPEPEGELEPAQYSNPHLPSPYPTGGTYTASETKVYGSMDHVAFAGMAVAMPTDLPVATTVWILVMIGAVIALTPQGKWALVGVFAPLYAKTKKDRLLESPRRERLIQAIEENPGINLTGLRKLMDLSWGTTVYHLRLLEDRSLITSVVGQGKRHFFMKRTGSHNAQLREAVAAIAGRETTQRLVGAILSEPGLSQRELGRRVGVSDRVVTHHMRRLRKFSLVETHRDSGRMRCHPTSLLAEAVATLANGLPQEPPIGTGSSADGRGSHYVDAVPQSEHPVRG